MILLLALNSQGACQLTWIPVDTLKRFHICHGRQRMTALSSSLIREPRLPTKSNAGDSHNRTSSHEVNCPFQTCKHSRAVCSPAVRFENLCVGPRKKSGRQVWLLVFLIFERIAVPLTILQVDTIVNSTFTLGSGRVRGYTWGDYQDTRCFSLKSILQFGVTRV